MKHTHNHTGWFCSAANTLFSWYLSCLIFCFPFLKNMFKRRQKSLGPNTDFRLSPWSHISVHLSPMNPNGDFAIFFAIRMILLQSLLHFILLLFLSDKNITKEGKEKVWACDGRQRRDTFCLEVWGQFHGPVDHSHGWIQRKDKEYDRVRTTGRNFRSCLRSAYR